MLDVVGVAVGGVAVGGVAVGGDPHILALPPEQGVIDRDDHQLRGRHQQCHHRAGDGQAHVVGIPAGAGEEGVRPVTGPGQRQPRPGRLGGAGPGSDVGDGEVGGVTAGDDAVGREDEPVGTGETSVLEVDLETVALALALGWLLDAGAGPGIDEGGLAIRAATTVATAATKAATTVATAAIRAARFAGMSTIRATLGGFFSFLCLGLLEATLHLASHVVAKVPRKSFQGKMRQY